MATKALVHDKDGCLLAWEFGDLAVQSRKSNTEPGHTFETLNPEADIGLMEEKTKELMNLITN